MISFCGYNFVRDIDSLNPFPTNLNNISSVQIQNAIYEHIDISKNVSFSFTTEIPKWDFDTIIDCDFETGIGAGNVDFTLGQLTSIKIKRRKKGDFSWITIQEIPINSEADLNMVKFDYFVPSNEEFEWALVPILNGVEGQYIVGSLVTEFNGVFISDVTNTFRLDAKVSYEGRSSLQSVGQITPLGRRFPVVIKNGEADYEVGTVSGTLLNDSFFINGEINRKEIVDKINNFNSFLKNGKPKIIKDYNGNIWLCLVTSNISVSYDNNYGMGIASVSFDWTEQGKYDNEDDLYDNGLIELDIYKGE